ncbi:hypothetical protein [Rhodanobacter sp. B04]|uniref:hypothetical protein n=1 Tax=Rhodanobacter sp. B04 TaxID=1945860 RepID=UPI0011159E30|nr:hypothetical protein [Rhodanobacter sp. B04]
MTNFLSKPQERKGRGLIWHLKWLLASYAASFGLFLIVLIASLPFYGYAFANWWFLPAGSVTQWVVAALVSPFVYGRLR